MPKGQGTLIATSVWIDAKGTWQQQYLGLVASHPTLYRRKQDVALAVASLIAQPGEKLKIANAILAFVRTEWEGTT